MALRQVLVLLGLSAVLMTFWRVPGEPGSPATAPTAAAEYTINGIPFEMTQSPPKNLPPGVAVGGEMGESLLAGTTLERDGKKFVSVGDPSGSLPVRWNDLGECGCAIVAAAHELRNSAGGSASVTTRIELYASQGRITRIQSRCTIGISTTPVPNPGRTCEEYLVPTPSR